MEIAGNLVAGCRRFDNGVPRVWLNSGVRCCATVCVCEVHWCPIRLKATQKTIDGTSMKEWRARRGTRQNTMPNSANSNAAAKGDDMRKMRRSTKNIPKKIKSSKSRAPCIPSQSFTECVWIYTCC